MKHRTKWLPLCRLCSLVTLVLTGLSLQAQTLINVDFGVGSQSKKIGFAATGQTSNDFWNLIAFYSPKYVPGTPLISGGVFSNLKLADGTATPVSIALSNAPGVWGNVTGDPMYDDYVFAQNGSNIVLNISNLEPGRYHFFFYGHADSDASGEQNSIFSLTSAGTNYGPAAVGSSTGWKAGLPWLEGQQFVALRDIVVKTNSPVVVTIAPGANGIAVLNGMQISSKGTSPPRLVDLTSPRTVSGPTNLIIREIRYEGRISDDQARFAADLELESMSTNEISAPLFEGEIAIQTKPLPEGVQIVRVGNEYRVIVSSPGKFSIKTEVAAKVTRAEPWNQIVFKGPAAAIASIKATSERQDMELQLLTGTPIGRKEAGQVEGFLGADRTVSLRWQSKAAEVSRRAFVTVETRCKMQLTPNVAKFTSEFRYELLQAGIPTLKLAIPTAQSLTRLVGEQVRDWKLQPTATNQILTIEFIKALENSYTLILHSEQSIEGDSSKVVLVPPQPIGVERESGMLSIYPEDTLVDLVSNIGLRQVSAAEGAQSAYRFFGRPISATVSVKPVEPVVTVADRLKARLEETRLMLTHSLHVNVEKTGVYALECIPQTGFTVTDVTGQGVDNWEMVKGKLRISFGNRLLGARQVDVQLEQPLKELPPQIAIAPLSVASATKETAQIGIAVSPGLRAKTAELTGLAEIPVGQLTNPSDELLGFNAQEPKWKLTLATEQLPARINAEVFNLVTIGDGLIGGSATVRYGLINQGVQQFRLKLPAHWKNVDFTGANIRSREQQGDQWTINLQEKAWGGYTLVVTYDYQFEGTNASIDAGGLHALDAEHETGSVAITTAANLKLHPAPVADPLYVIDPSELAETDRALITRKVLLAYRYTGNDYKLQIQVARHDEEQGLDAVADRAQLTSVISDSGEMLTQASFMVKNNEKQFQRFELPKNATFWGCYVNGEPSKAERDGDWLLVALPRSENSDETYTVDLVYRQVADALKSRVLPKSMEFSAPRTDVPNTYAEWELFVPRSQRILDFGGTMSVARGTTYGLRDAWNRFLQTYSSLWREAGEELAFSGAVGFFLIVVTVVAIRRGWRGAATALLLIVILGILSAMLLPSMSRAKMKAQSASSMSNLRLIDGAMQQYILENKGKVPSSLEDLRPYLGRGAGEMPTDPVTGQPYVYVGAGKKTDDPNAIIAYSPAHENRRTVLTGHGIEQMTEEQFAAALERETAAIAGVSGVRLRGGSYTYSASVSDSLDAVPMGAPEMPVPPPPPAPTAAPPLALSTAGVAGSAPENLDRGGGSEVWSEKDFEAASIQPNAPAVAGIRSIRIEIPRNGQPYTFTKVLNIHGEPLAVKISIMSATAFAVIRSALQLSAFGFGLALIWLAWRSRNSLRLAAGLALSIGSVIALMISMRMLHVAFITAAPIVVGGMVVWLIAKLWKHSAPAASADSTPPVVASIVVLLAFSGFSALGETEAKASVSDHPASAVVINQAIYSGIVSENSAQFEGSLELASSKTNQTIVLFGEDVALQEVNVKTGSAKLVREHGKVALLLPDKGAVELTLKFLAKLEGTVSKRELKFGLPSALSSHLTVTIPDAEAEVEFPTAISMKRSTNAQNTIVEAVIGSEDRVDLRWTPRVKRAAEIAATVFVESHSIASLGGGVLSVQSTLNYQITQGELRQARIQLPANHRLLRVEGEAIRTWEIKREGEAEVLIVDLLKGASPKWQVSLELEKTLQTLPSSMEVKVPEALDVKRQHGFIAIRNSEELSLTVEQARQIQRVDSADYFAATKKQVAELFAAYQFLKPDFELWLRVESVQPQIEVTIRSDVQIDTDQISVAAQCDYLVQKAGIFSVQLRVPANYQVQGVTGENIQNWELTDSNSDLAPQTLSIAFKSRIIGAYPLKVMLTRRGKELPKSVNVEGVHPLEARKIKGFVTVAGQPGVAVKTSVLDGITEVPPASIGANIKSQSGSTLLAYKYIIDQPSRLPGWKLEVSTETVEPWLRAEIATTIAASETLLSGRTLIRYEIQNAPVREFRVKLPTAYKNVEITGNQIRRRDQTGEEWRVELQNKVHGIYTLTVTWEQPIRLGTNEIEIAGATALGVERETGTLAIKAKAPLQVAAKSVSGELIKIDARELPDWAQTEKLNSGSAVVVAYRYVRGGWSLGVEARRFEEAAVLQALVEDARLTTVVAADGQLITQLNLSVRNNGLQHLELELPVGSKVWSAFVAGLPVRPARNEGRLLVPLENASCMDDAALSVELIYVGAEKFPVRKGNVNLESPAFDVPLKNASWNVYLPPDYTYGDFGGTMNLSSAASELQSYSLAEYRVQEATRKGRSKAEARRVIDNAKQVLTQTGATYFNDAYNQLRGSVAQDKTVEEQVIELQKGFSRKQGSNLIQAQQQYSAENAISQKFDYDVQTAEKQWAKLQQAQELSAKRVQPLRVNLPTRGLQYTFSQVLQTEVKKPMTVQFVATNTERTNWFSAIVLCVIGFGALWVLAFFVQARRKN